MGIRVLLWLIVLGISAWWYLRGRPGPHATAFQRYWPVIPGAWALVLALTGRIPLIVGLGGLALALLPWWKGGAPRGFRERGRGGEPMSRAEACAVLGVPETASREEILEAYRRLIARMHPDRGGTADLAARINRAKETLLPD